jgi:hypothetical protein
MIRILAYIVCLSGFLWLGLGSLRFRQSIRTTLNGAYSELHRLDPDSSDVSGKILNSYYESVYSNLPHTVLPATMLMLGATVLLLTKKTMNR